MAPDSLDSASTATASSQAPQQVDYHPSQAPEKGESSIATGEHTSEPSRTHELMSGILRIVPPEADVRNITNTAHHRPTDQSCSLTVLPFLQIDADYWLASDVDATVTDTWGT